MARRCATARRLHSGLTAVRRRRPSLHTGRGGKPISARALASALRLGARSQPAPRAGASANTRGAHNTRAQTCRARAASAAEAVIAGTTATVGAGALFRFRPRQSASGILQIPVW